MKQGRIEYIDAMRGFTMILVVWAHVYLFCLGETTPNTFNQLLLTFRMPLFFFISGYILYKQGRVWNLRQSASFLYKKFKVQIVSTLIFLTLFCLTFNLSIANSLCSVAKSGYWFTLQLFQFFLIYVIIQLLFHKTRQLYADIALLAACVVTVVISKEWSFAPHALYGLLSLAKMKYFPYFVMGIFAKRHISRFNQMLSSRYLLAALVLTYTLLFIPYSHIDENILSHTMELPLGAIGLLIVFSIFHTNQHLFTRVKLNGRVLQYIGTRTLDIYFLHFFIIQPLSYLVFPLSSLVSRLSSLVFPLSSLVSSLSSLVFTTIVIAGSLLISKFIRISPTLSQYLFGKK